MSLQTGVAIGVGVAAIVDDLRRRQIANWISVAGVAGGLVAAGYERGWRGLGGSAAGAVAGFLVFLVFYLLGGMGGGDVKLMAAFGAILGLDKVLAAALWTAGVGGILALAAVAWASLRKRTGEGDRPAQAAIPYAPAIAVGAWLALVPQP